jgi:hypothetical protein
LPGDTDGPSYQVDNHADLEKFRGLVAEVPWRVPNAVQLFLLDQQEFFFRLWMIRDGLLTEVPVPQPHEEDDGFWLGGP